VLGLLLRHKALLNRMQICIRFHRTAHGRGIVLGWTSKDRDL